MNAYLSKKFHILLTAASGTPVSVASTGDKAYLEVLVPMDITRWGFIVTTTLTGAPVFKMDQRVVAGSDAGRVTGATTAGGVDTAGGTLTPGTLAAGKVGYRNLNLNPGPFKVNPGQEVVIQVSTAAGAGAGYFFVEYEAMPFVGVGTGGAGTPTPALTDANRISNATKFSI